MGGTPRNIFQIVGEVSGDVVKQEAQELAQLRQQEETFAAMKTSSTAQSKARAMLLKRQEEYSFDGNLAADATQDLEDSIADTASQITSDTVRRRFEQNMSLFKDDYKNKAEAIQLTKHKEKQQADWNNLEAEDTAEIALTGDRSVLNQKLAKWQANEDGFFGDVKDSLLPKTLAGFTKTYLNTELDNIEAGIASNTLTPEQAEIKINELKKDVLGNPKAYKLSADDIRIYSKKIGDSGTRLKTAGNKIYQESINQQYTAAKALVDKGELSPLSEEYQVIANEKIRIAPAKERSALIKEQMVLGVGGQGAVAANQGQFAKATATRNAMLERAEKAKAAGDLELANKFLDGAETLKKYKDEKQDQFYNRQGDFFENNATIETMFQENPGQAVATMGLKVKGQVSRSTFRPLSTTRSKELVDILESTGSDVNAFGEAVRTIRGMYDAPVGAFGNTPAYEFVFNQLELDIAKNKNPDDPYTLGEKKALLLRYSDDPRNLQALWNTLTVDTGSVDKPSDVKKQVNKQVNKFFEATADLADLDRSTIPVSHQAQLIKDVAIGLKADDPSLDDGAAAKKAINMTIGKDFKVIKGVHDTQMISVNTPSEIEDAMKTGYQSREIMLNNLKAEDLSFPDIYKLDGDRTVDITENAIKTYGTIQQINGVYRFYLKFGDEYRPVMSVDENGQERYIELTEPEMRDQTKKVQVKERTGSSVEIFTPTEQVEI